MATKKITTKAPAKKAISVKKAPSAKKPAPAKKVVTAKKAVTAKDPLPEKSPAPSTRVPPRITPQKSIVITKAPTKPVELIDTEKTVSAAMSVIEKMKRKSLLADAKRQDEEVRLSRRPTSRDKNKRTEKFPAADLRDFKKRLVLAREQAEIAISQIRGTGFDESDDHEADGGDGTNQTLRLQALGQLGNLNRTIQQIEEALHRIKDGSYGVCSACGQLIRKPRLLNQPFVLTCMECQSEMERNGK